MTTLPRSQEPQKHPMRNSTASLIVSWLVVGLPLAWGVIQTIIKSMALFH